MNPSPNAHRFAPERALELGRQTLSIEAAAVEALQERLTGDFARAVELILNSHGRLIVSGMGKSGHIARKIAATMASTGTPAYFVHPAEASHGDLGMITRDDVLLALSAENRLAELLGVLYDDRRILRGDLGESLAELITSSCKPRSFNSNVSSFSEYFHTRPLLEVKYTCPLTNAAEKKDWLGRPDSGCVFTKKGVCFPLLPSMQSNPSFVSSHSLFFLSKKTVLIAVPFSFEAVDK
jgi:hypothetical protein